ncbi:MAG TPA: S41 family peptidase [Kiritimatiellia bacterium]|nr:S41 family peptidase [Kiritimatiellia bacterium]
MKLRGVGCALLSGWLLVSGCSRPEAVPAPVADETQREELNRLVAALSIVQRHFVYSDSTAMTNLLQLALAGLTRQLDGSSQLVVGEDAGFEPDSIWLAMAEPGWVVGLRRGAVEVLAVDAGGSAEAAGVRVGDVVIRWRGTAATLSEMKRSGAAMAEARLRRRDQDVEYEIEVAVSQRGVEPGVTAEWIGDSIRLVRVRHAGPEWATEAVRRMTERLDRQVTAWVFDVRSLASLDVEGARRVAGVLVPKGNLLWLVGAKGEEGVLARVDSPGPGTRKEPVWVLIGPGTGGGGELLAAGLRAGGRANLAGTPTRGGAQVVRRTELEPGVALFLTSGWYEEAEGRRIGGAGLVPDVTEPPQWGEAEVEEKDRLLDRVIELIQSGELFS